ncbi:MAG: APC family permease [Sphingomonadaceae bacterium]|uniref:APC family permease n=1 Tax=Thermaurantiacus sp. TaxID=2820283 RepID=UPI00298EDDF7|nr:APC family permease [Thermaurantiacus sp.]MCS6987846.1 APC family permease [Sphingomonadaceae bacterium]MDW8414934.1 APC family permease [Thermaurantiacus sp.]
MLGLGFGLATVVGGVIGAGILRQPGVVAEAIPHPALILVLWAAGGLMAAINALTVVELGASLPRAGGPYAVVGHALGPRAGALVGWADWFNGMSTLAFLAVAFAEFLARAGVGAHRPPGQAAVALVVAAFLMNAVGTRGMGRVQTLLSTLKGLALAVLVGALFLAPAAPAPPRGPEAPVLELAGLALALSAIHNTYTGYQTPLYMGEEMERPDRHVARAVFGGLALVSALYLLVNMGLLHALGPEGMAGSSLALADGAQRVFGSEGALLVAGFGALSVAASVNLRLMTHARGAFAMARDGVLPPPLARVAPGGTPLLALVLTTAGAVGLAASGAYLALVAVNAPLRLLIEIALVASLMRLRRTEPHRPRPFRMPLYPWPAVLALAVDAVLLVAVVWEDPVHSAVALGAVGLAALFVWAR